MDVHDMRSILGLSTDDPRCAQLLDAFGIGDRPSVKIDESDPNGPIVATQAWLRNPRLGIEFGFDDTAAWNGRSKFEFGHGMRLTQLYLYGRHTEMSPYADALPFGLRWVDDREAVRAKLDAHGGARRSYRRDVWQFEGFALVVSYGEGDASVNFLLAMLDEPPWPLPAYELQDPPKLAALAALLGPASEAGPLRESFAALGLDSGPLYAGRKHTCDCRYTGGFDVHVVPVESTGDPVFAVDQFTLYRERELEARGWKGNLPFALVFDDSPESAIEKIGSAPADQEDDEYTGYAVWHFDTFSLHVFYSTIQNVLLRVRVMAPGTWQSFVDALAMDDA